MDAYSDPTIHTLVFQKSSQVGATEVLLNILGYHIDVDPGPVLIILPSVETGESWSKDRLAPMLRDSPNLAGKVSEPRSKDSDNTVRHKAFPGGHLTIVGANAPSGLAMRPIRIVLCDEIDRYPASAGKEGDPITLAIRRTAGFTWNKKIVLVSTPTIKGLSRVEIAYEASDKRRFHVPCPHCGHYQILRWAQVKWSEPYGDGTASSARYHCEQCDKGWSDPQRWAAVRKGEWRGERPCSGVAGFHLNELYSSFVVLRDPVQLFLDSKPYPDMLKTWVNTVLGETWEDQGEEVDDANLSKRRETWQAPSPQILLITCGVDVQGDRLEVTRIGWGVLEQAWVLEHVIIHGDPSGYAIWEQLDNYLLTPTRLADGREVWVYATCVDSGGHYTGAVHAYCRTRIRRRVWAIKGEDGPRPMWPKKASRTMKGKDYVYIVGVDTGKDLIYGRLRQTQPGPGYIHLPITADAEYLKQLTSEVVVTKYRKGFPVRVWQPKPNTRNEALDCFVYALAALRSLRVSWAKVPQPKEQGTPAPQEQPEQQAAEGEVKKPQEQPPQQPAVRYPGSLIGKLRGRRIVVAPSFIKRR